LNENGSEMRTKTTRATTAAEIFSLAGRVAVITGAASGQGLASAQLFATAGARVVLLDRDVPRGEEAAAKIAATGADATFYPVDLEDAEAVASVCTTILERYEQVDVLFNNAGIGFNPKYVLGTIFDGTMADWNGVLGINLNGAVLMTRCLAPSMRKRKSGSIIFNVSIAAIVGIVGTDAYTASKGALTALTRSLAALMGPDNVRVNAIAPGAILTPMLTPILEAGGMKARLQGTPMRRLGLPEEIASTALFLASDASSFMTAQVVVVDGGRSAI